ncbi:hypothetical protein SDC9_50569 [bioreactor metagenome]|uniref:Peptidase S8/S53 domain-containing protein n=1 Tax=bioreactor metagenome TaxID=1076179 RepID=A0A644WPR5_9ZZZZ
MARPGLYPGRYRDRVHREPALPHHLHHGGVGGLRDKRQLLPGEIGQGERGKNYVGGDRRIYLKEEIRTSRSFLEPILSLTDALTVDENTFNFLDAMTGRKSYYRRGYYGNNLTAAVIDTGINKNHIEFKDSFGNSRIVGGKSFCSYTTSYTDDNGHGSHTAGTIAGLNCGVAPKANLLVIKALGGDGDNSVENIISAFDYAKNWRNPTTGKPVDVISSSLSIAQRYMTEAQIEKFNNVCNSIVSSGIPLFVSSGNTGTDSTPRYPSFYEDPITCGAVDLERRVATYSTQSSSVDICQLGSNVVSVSHTDNKGYVRMTGTSMSTPMCAGTALLLANQYYQVSKERITEEMLYKTIKFLYTHDIDDAGVDKKTGAGFFTLNPFPPTTISIQVGNKSYYIDGVAKQMDVAPIYAKADDGNSRMMVPTRFVAEALGHTVNWYSTSPDWAYIQS